MKEIHILRIKDVLLKLKIGKSTLYDWLNKNSPRYKSDLPRPFKISSKSIGWIEEELDAWIEKRKNNRV
ncbi:TPA: AlpA family phage regulatory protein [Proteus mirabilis]